MNRAELRQSLNVSDRRLSEWIKAGLPRSRQRPGVAYDYDPDAVSAWLIDNGHAQAPQVVQTIGEVAEHFHRTERQIRNWARDGMPGGTAGPWDLDAVADWRDDRRARTAADPLLTGPSSPALEEYRKHRAELARLEVLERKRVLIDRRAIEPTMQRFSQVIRSAVETLQRQFGPQAAQIIDDALIDSLRVVDSLNVNDGSNSPTQADQE